MTKTRNLQILSKGKEILENSLGIKPVSFRPGNFSASKDTFEVLTELGFTQGSISDPGRNCPEYAAVWDNSNNFPYWIYLRIKVRKEISGHTCHDPTRKKRHPNGFPYELRIESGGFADWHMPIISRYLNKLEKDDMPYGCLCVFTHNIFSYNNQADRHMITLKKMIEFIKEIDKYEIVPSTFKMIREDIENN